MIYKDNLKSPGFLIQLKSSKAISTGKHNKIGGIKGSSFLQQSKNCFSGILKAWNFIIKIVLQRSLEPYWLF